MYPRIGPVSTYGILYLLGFVAHFLIGRRAAHRLGLRRRVWITAGVCYIVGMTAGAKFLFHAREVGFDPMVIFSVERYKQGGLWGGLPAYIRTFAKLKLGIYYSRKSVSRFSENNRPSRP